MARQDQGKDTEKRQPDAMAESLERLRGELGRFAGAQLHRLTGGAKGVRRAASSPASSRPWTSGCRCAPPANYWCEYDDITSSWKAKIGPSTRDWKATVMEQVPDDRIEWTSEGSGGSTRGVVSFHELAPSLTRIVVVVQYHPAGFFRYVTLEAEEEAEGCVARFARARSCAATRRAWPTTRSTRTRAAVSRGGGRRRR